MKPTDPNYLSPPEQYVQARQRREKRRERSAEITWFNLRQAHVVAGQPTIMQAALRAAMGPPNEKAPAATGAQCDIGGGVNQQSKATPVAAHLQRLRDLYAGGRGE